MKDEKVNTTQEIAIDFAQRAVSSINKQLAKELDRCGFDMKLIRKGKLKLNRVTKVSETDPRYIAETFSVEGKKVPERIILCVKWSPSGFQMEANSDAIANAIKVNKNFAVKKGAPTLFVGQVTQREIEVEALANEYMKKDEAQLKKSIKGIC